MNAENTEKLFADFPKLYVELDSFECDDCWFETIYKLSEDLYALAERGYEPDDLQIDIPVGGYHPIAFQVKEKNNGLRFYASALSSEMRNLIYDVEAIESHSIISV